MSIRRMMLFTLGGFFKSIISLFKTRVLNDSGTFEAETNLENQLNNLGSTLFDSASLAITPNGVKTSKLYSIKPNDGTGDLDVIRNTSATRIDENGNIVNVPANVARIDYSNGSPAILVEPQRTNLALKSNAFSDAVWAKTNVTANDNNGIGIDGNLSASLITISSTANFLFQVFTCLPNTTYTFTFYVKRGTMTDLKYRFRDQTNNIDVIPATSYYSQTNSTTFTRITVTLTTPAGCISFRFSPIADTGSIGTCYITSAQIEVGSNATSYIPTTTSTVTRNADVISNTNASNLIGQTEGCLFLDFVPTTVDSTARYISISNSSSVSNGWFGIFASTSTNTFRFYGDGFDVNIGTLILNNRYKIVLNYKNGVVTKIFINGVNVSTITANNTGKSYNFIQLATAPIGTRGNANFNCISLFKNIISDQQAIQLTTL